MLALNKTPKSLSCFISQHVYVLLPVTPPPQNFTCENIGVNMLCRLEKPSLCPGNSSWSPWWLLCLLQCGYNKVQTRWTQPSNELPLGLVFFFQQQGWNALVPRKVMEQSQSQSPPIYTKCWGQIPLPTLHSFLVLASLELWLLSIMRISKMEIPSFFTQCLISVT